VSPDRGSDAAQEEGKLPPNVTREALPSREIAGFHADGMRTTTTIPAQDGAPAATVVDEVWESPEWRMPLLHIHDDSRTGRSQAEVTALAKGAPDEALFHAPRGYTVNDWQLATDRRVVLAKPSPLPAPILDDNLAAAADRMDTAATAHAETLTPVHVKYELTMIDYNGQKHMGTMESWRSTAGYRYELHSDAYNEVHVSDFASLRQWEMKQGTEPLRVSEFKLYEIQPTFAEARLLHGGGTVPRLKPLTVADIPLTCAGDEATATVCFDQVTGFVVSGTMGAQEADYQGWTKVGWKYMPGTVRLTYAKRTLVEAKLVVAAAEFSPEVFAQVDGLREITPMRPAPGAALPVARMHRIYLRGRPTTLVQGSALVHVWVDGKGRVSRAEVLDADDAMVASAALEAAEKTMFYPERENGQPSPFEASIFSTGTASFAVRP
jgi:TonB family protein